MSHKEANMERPREAYCQHCKMFNFVDDNGRCQECGKQLLEPLKKAKKKKKKK